MVDHSPWRRSLGIYSASIIIITNTFQIFVSEDTWFLICIFQIPCVVFYNAHLLCLFAYIPELTDDDDERAHVTGIAKAFEQAMILLFFFLTAAFGMALCPAAKDDDNDFDPEIAVCQARVAQTMTCVVGGVFMMKVSPRWQTHAFRGYDA